MVYVAFTITVMGSLAIGAYLVVNGHPWFGFLAMLIGASVSMNHKKDEK